MAVPQRIRTDVPNHPVSGSRVYALTNWTADLDIDCNSASNDELSDLLGTVIKDLIAAGILTGTVAAA